MTAQSSHIDVPDYLAVPSGPKSSVLRFARMTGSSIAARDAAPWVTDFLNAAYFRRPAADRQVDDLRLAFAILTTFWYRKPWESRLRFTDLPRFHKAFGSHRLSAGGTLDRGALQAGATSLIGDWFADAYADAGRRGWGMAFPSVEDKSGYDYAKRAALARLGRLTPESAPVGEQVWHSYPAVEMPSADAVIGALTRPETWPDYASEIGRFTPLRPGGLLNQTFEIEVAAGAGAGLPIFTRGYVTVTKLVTSDTPDELTAWFAALEHGLATYADGESPVVPEGGTPLLGFDLTTHHGHFMGSGHSRLLLYTHDAKAWLRAVDTWDPMPWHINQAYRLAGRDAQHAFWGQGNLAAQSMLHQLAQRIA